MKGDWEKVGGKACTAPAHTVLGFSPFRESYFQEHQIQQIQRKKKTVLESALC